MDRKRNDGAHKREAKKVNTLVKLLCTWAHQGRPKYFIINEHTVVSLNRNFNNVNKAFDSYSFESFLHVGTELRIVIAAREKIKTNSSGRRY